VNAMKMTGQLAVPEDPWSDYVAQVRALAALFALLGLPGLWFFAFAVETTTPLAATGRVAALIVCLLFVLAALGTFRLRGPMIADQAATAITDLKRLGDPDALAAEIRQEIDDGFDRIGPAYLTSSWLLSSQVEGVDAVPISSLVWVYEDCTTYLVGVLPVTRRILRVHDRTGHVTGISCSMHELDRLMSALQVRMPSALYGFDHSYKRMARKDFAGLVRLVDGG